MKKTMKSVWLGALLLGGVLLSNGIMAQAPAPPPPPGSHGTNTNQSPLSAPIDGGLVVFMAFAAGYAGREWMKRK